MSQKPLKRLHVPHLGREVVFGRRRPTEAQRATTPHLGVYLARRRGTMPTPPSTCDYSPKAIAALRQLYLNNALGDCVIAQGYHGEGVATGNAGPVPFIASAAQIIADYGAIGGYVPGDPSTDQGCDVPTALDYWTRVGFANKTRLAGRIAVDPTNPAQIILALWLFENLFFGVDLPDSWITPFPSRDGFVWGIDPAGVDPQNGHAYGGVGYDARSGVKITTWGMLGIQTFPAIAETCVASAGGELYALLTPDLIAKGQARAPNGLDWATLVADFDAMGGKVPAPPPPPPPAPAPVLLSLDQAIALLRANWPAKSAVSAPPAAGGRPVARHREIPLAHPVVAGPPRSPMTRPLPGGNTGTMSAPQRVPPGARPTVPPERVNRPGAGGGQGFRRHPR